MELNKRLGAGHGDRTGVLTNTDVSGHGQETRIRRTHGRCRSCNLIYRWPSGTVRLRDGACRCPQCGRRLTVTCASAVQCPIVDAVVLESPQLPACAPGQRDHGHTLIGVVRPPRGGHIDYLGGGTLRIVVPEPPLPSWLHDEPGRALAEVAA